MNNMIRNQDGVTLIETVAATAIAAIILISIVGALLYGKKMIVFTDTKNNAASIAQDKIDEVMAQITSGNVPPDSTNIVNGHKIITDINKVDKDKDTIEEGCDIKIQVYYNNNESFIELTAYTLIGGIDL